jgi:hypothetical protein
MHAQKPQVMMPHFHVGSEYTLSTHIYLRSHDMYMPTDIYSVNCTHILTRSSFYFYCQLSIVFTYRMLFSTNLSRNYCVYEVVCTCAHCPIAEDHYVNICQHQPRCLCPPRAQADIDYSDVTARRM